MRYNEFLRVKRHDPGSRPYRNNGNVSYGRQKCKQTCFYYSRHAAVRVCAGHVRGQNQTRKFFLEGGTVWFAARGTRAKRKGLVGARPIGHKFLALSTFASAPAFTPWRIVGGRIMLQQRPITHNKVGMKQTQSVRKSSGLAVLHEKI